MRRLLLLLLAAPSLSAQTAVEPQLDPFEKVADLQDGDLLNNFLTRAFSVDDIYLDSEHRDELARGLQDLSAAAQRRLAREDSLLQRAMTLVNAGHAPAGVLTPIQSEMTKRLETVTLAMEHTRLLEEIIADARRAARHPGLSSSSIMERYPGRGLYSPEYIKIVSIAFRDRFHHLLPVSAHGMTATHRALGFDHTGRFDIAVHPDQAEGVWLRKYLQTRGIPYFAFRRAVLGSSTAPHIHIGPGSTRIRRAAAGAVALGRP